MKNKGSFADGFYRFIYKSIGAVLLTVVGLTAIFGTEVSISYNTEKAKKAWFSVVTGFVLENGVKIYKTVNEVL